MKRKPITYLAGILAATIIFAAGSSRAATHFTESFTGAFATDAYYSGTVVLGSGSWDYSEIRGEISANSYYGTGSAARLNKEIVAGSYLISPSVNSVGTVSFYYRCLNSLTGSIKIQKSVNSAPYTDIGTQTVTSLTYAQYSVVVNDASNNIKIRIISENSPGIIIVDEVTITNYDITPPIVTASAQSATNGIGQTVLAQSNEPDGFVYIIKDGVTQATLSDLNTAVTNLQGAKSPVTVANTDISISTTDLEVGDYYAYAVDEAENISTKGTNLIQVTTLSNPIMSGAVRDSDTQISITLSTNADPLTTTKANDGGFTVFETGTPATTYTVTAINPGITDNIVVLTVNNFFASHAAGVTITYTEGGNGTVTSDVGAAMLTDAVGKSISAWGHPVISSAAFSNGDYFIGSTITLIVQTDGTGYTLGTSTVNGHGVTGFGSAGGNDYLMTYTVVEGDPDATDVNDVSLSVILENDGVFSTAYTGPATGTLTIDATRPVVQSAIRVNNTEISVLLSELAGSSTITAANDGGFIVKETGTPTTIYNVSAINPGATDDIVILTVDDMVASNVAGVTVTYVSGGNGAVADVAGNLMSTDATGKSTGAWDVPLLSVSTATLTGFTFVEGSGPSTSQTYSISGTNLTGAPGDITVTAPTNYEVSTDDISFSASASVAYTSATLASTPVYVRLKAGLAASTYNAELVTNAGGGATTQNVTCSGEVTAFAPGPCITEGFDAGTTAPTDWTFTSIGGTYTTATNFGLSSPSVKFDGTGDQIETPTVSNATELSFWIKGQGIDAVSALLVEGFNGSWVTIENLTNSLPTTGTVKTYNSGSTPALAAGFTKFRFTYTKSSGNLAFDDVSVTCGSGPATPTLIASATSLSGFTYIEGSGPSTSQTYNLSGTDLTGAPGNITVTAPTNYEVSDDNSTFSPSISVAYTSATLASTPIYVRLKSGLSVNTYNAEIVTNAGGGATTVNVSCSGEVTAIPTPTLIASVPTLSGFTYMLGAGPSVSKIYSISGSDLTGAPGYITITAPTDYEVSFNNTSFSPSLDLPYSSSTLASNTIYVRLRAGLAVNTYNSEVVTNAGGGATTVDVTCNGEVTAIPPATLTTSVTSLTGFTYMEGAGPSASQSYNISGTFLTGAPGSIKVKAPTNYEVSANNSTFLDSIAISYTTATLASTPVYVRLKSGLLENTYNGEIITNSGGGDTAVSVTCNGSVTAYVSGPCLDEGFDAGMAQPTGWTFTNIDAIYTSAGNFGASSPSIRFDATGDMIETPAVSGATELSFWIKGQTATGSYLLVEAFNGLSWASIDNILLTTITTGTTKTYNSGSTPALAAGFTKFRFTYTKSVSNLAFDDVYVTCGSTPGSPAFLLSTSTLTGFTYVEGSGPSTSQSYNLSGTDLTGAPGNITVTAPTNYEVSDDNSTFGTSVSVAYTSGTLASTPVYVRLKAGLAANTYNAELVANAGGGATTVNVSCDGEVTALIIPIITAVDFADGDYKIDDDIATTITANDTGFTSGAITINGRAVTNFADNGDNTYSVTYTVLEGDADVTSAAVIPISVVLSNNGTENSPFTGNPGGNITIDANRPVITAVARISDTEISVATNELLASGSITSVNDGGFVVKDLFDSLTTYSVTQLNPGSADDTIVLTASDLGGSALNGLFVRYTQGGNGLITDAAGNLMLSDTIRFEIPAWDNTAVGNVDFSSGFSILPNPNRGEFTLIINDSDIHTGEILIIDVMGRTVASTTLLGHATQQQVSFNIEGMAAGVYSVVLHSERGVVTRKMVVE
ncbi:MAG: T9SS type A sorting domain-containing protein [Bacteroidetes bacterium]|nr:T9SS type A sorting domain-containing protein [Bacteroidota bacterium]MBU1720801.1 T9SS type A sorting domain-containing protein [Bacteroidota bacterium]